MSAVPALLAPEPPVPLVVVPPAPLPFPAPVVPAAPLPVVPPAPLPFPAPVVPAAPLPVVPPAPLPFPAPDPALLPPPVVAPPPVFSPWRLGGEQAVARRRQTDTPRELSANLFKASSGGCWSWSDRSTVEHHRAPPFASPRPSMPRAVARVS